MALIPAGYCCKVRYVARCLANVQLLLAFVRVKKGLLICWVVSASVGNGEKPGEQRQSNNVVCYWLSRLWA